MLVSLVQKLLISAIAALPEPLQEALQRVRQSVPFVGRATGAAARWLRDDHGVVRRGPGAGLVLQTSGGKLGYVLGTNELPVQEHLVRLLRPGATFYDVGANIGFFSMLAARAVGPAGRVVAFEPVPELAETIRANAAANGMENVVVVERAAYSHSGSADFAVPADPVGGSVDPEGLRTGRRITVELVAVDDLVRKGELPTPDVVKLDVEGAELDVLTGMEETLARARPAIVCELHGTDDDRVKALCARLGYEVQLLSDGRGIDNSHILARPQDRQRPREAVDA